MKLVVEDRLCMMSTVRCVWYGSGAPFDSVLLAVALCSVLVTSFIFPLLETIVSGLVNRNRFNNGSIREGAVQMAKNIWKAIANICYGLTGGILILTRRNEPFFSHTDRHNVDLCGARPTVPAKMACVC